MHYGAKGEPKQTGTQGRIFTTICHERRETRKSGIYTLNRRSWKEICGELTRSYKNSPKITTTKFFFNVSKNSLDGVWIYEVFVTIKAPKRLVQTLV